TTAFIEISCRDSARRLGVVAGIPRPARAAGWGWPVGGSVVAFLAHGLAHFLGRRYAAVDGHAGHLEVQVAVGAQQLVRAVVVFHKTVCLGVQAHSLFSIGSEADSAAPAIWCISPSRAVSATGLGFIARFIELRLRISFSASRSRLFSDSACTASNISRRPRAPIRYPRRKAVWSISRSLSISATA